MQHITEQLLSLHERMEAAKKNSPIAQENVTIVAASKTQSTEHIIAAIDAGVTCFGENKVQEAAEKWPAIKAQYPKIELQLIGPLQTNKARQAVASFDTIATLDRLKLADILAQEMQQQEKRPACFIQVNTGEEPQKGGVLPQDADEFITYCRETAALPIVGLMCIPPANQPAAVHFAYLKKLADTHGLTRLSMGMSSDFEAAIRLGATEIRIGTALFGQRNIYLQ